MYAIRSYYAARGLELTLSSGQSIMVDCAVSPLSDEAGAAQLLLELKQVDRLLRLARDERVLRTQIANRAILAGLAHEIKNPLGGLRGAAQLLARELGENPLKEYTAIIIDEADRLRALVDRMMTPSRPLARESLNLHQILERVCSLIEVENPRTIRIDREYDPSLPNLMADTGQLTQAVLNILCNAVEAVQRKGRVITSYSIHYTKLYDKRLMRASMPTCESWVSLPAPVVVPQATSRATLAKLRSSSTMAGNVTPTVAANRWFIPLWSAASSSLGGLHTCVSMTGMASYNFV